MKTRKLLNDEISEELAVDFIEADASGEEMKYILDNIDQFKNCQGNCVEALRRERKISDREEEEVRFEIIREIEMGK